nr:polysaccharide biosynthesis C-terminal domain-containing protein [Clostridiales bacterium]
YGAVLDFRNLVPAITMTLGVSAIPAIASAWATRNNERIKQTVNSVVKTAMLISMPAGIGMAVLSRQILALVYSGTRSQNLVEIAAPMLVIYALSTPLISISAPVTNMLQATSNADIPIKALFIGSLAKIVSNYILVGNSYLNINGAPIGSVICYVVVVSYEVYFLLKFTKTKLDVFEIFIKPFFASLIMGIVTFFSYSYATRIFNSKISTLISMVISGIIYIFLLFLMKIVSKNDIFSIFSGEKFVKVLEKS